MLQDYGDGFATQDAYDSVFKVGSAVGTEIGAYPTKTLVHLKNTGSKTLCYKVYLSNDRSNWFEARAETDVAASGSVRETLTEAWKYIDVQVKSKAAGQATIVRVEVRALRGAG